MKSFKTWSSGSDLNEFNGIRIGSFLLLKRCSLLIFRNSFGLGHQIFALCLHLNWVFKFRSGSGSYYTTVRSSLCWVLWPFHSPAKTTCVAPCLAPVASITVLQPWFCEAMFRRINVTMCRSHLLPRGSGCWALFSWPWQRPLLFNEDKCAETSAYRRFVRAI